MSISTDGQICFGIVFEDTYQFPWNEEKYDNDIESWWVEGIHGYRPPFEMFDAAGRWIGGSKWPQDKIDSYYADKHKFVESIPKLPVELVNYCSGDYPEYILAVPSSCKSCSRGYPKTFDPEKLQVTEEEVNALLDFCIAHGIENKNKPHWYLTSYWG